MRAQHPWSWNALVALVGAVPGMPSAAVRPLAALVWMDWTPSLSKAEKEIWRLLGPALTKLIQLHAPEMDLDDSKPVEPHHMDPTTGEPVYVLSEPSDAGAHGSVPYAKRLRTFRPGRRPRGGVIALAVDMLRACGCTVEAAADCVRQLYPVIGWESAAPDSEAVTKQYNVRRPEEFRKVDEAGRERTLTRFGKLADTIETRNPD